MELKLRCILTLLFCVIISHMTVCQQKDYALQPSEMKGEKLAFRIEKIKVETSKEESETAKRVPAEVSPVLHYDFTSQYPWYGTRNTDWVVGESYRIEFTNMPQKGFIYLYSVDGSNEVETHGVIKLEEGLKSPFQYPIGGRFEFTTNGADYLVLWYTRDTIPQIERRIKSIELTLGEFVKRNNGQIGDKLVLPEYGWEMLSKEFGFATDMDLFQFSEGEILPIIVRFDVQAKVSVLPPKNKKGKT
jgi:hypothetical protein